eukprot:SAG11_NODE_1950_length_4013_cov_4.004854_6_plen_135_part_00
MVYLYTSCNPLRRPSRAAPLPPALETGAEFRAQVGAAFAARVASGLWGGALWGAVCAGGAAQLRRAQSLAAAALRPPRPQRRAARPCGVNLLAEGGNAGAAQRREEGPAGLGGWLSETMRRGVLRLEGIHSCGY